MKDILYFNTLEDIKLTDMMRVSKKKEEHDYSKDYLTFEALEDGTFTLTINKSLSVNYVTSVSYSINNGNTWITTPTVSDTDTIITTPTVKQGQRVLWKGIADAYSNTANYKNNSNFTSTGNFNVMGNIMSLLYGDDFIGTNAFPNSTKTGIGFGYMFTTPKLIDAKNLILPITDLSASGGQYGGYYAMFQGCTSLITAPVLPATTLGKYCYGYMFTECKALTTAPKLSATTLADGCYLQMFSNCTSLTAAPELPTTTLVKSCYGGMFNNCTSLITAPTLPAITLAENCYSGMFNGCIALVNAPELPATTLVSNCYKLMFNNCSSLNNIKALFTTTPSTSYTHNWVSGVAATGTFVKNSAATWDVTGNNGIPSGWTVETVAVS